ncbi:MAG TPA: hypothetical protein VGK31_15080 [Thermoanaerobaculia bacterium]
MRLALNIYIRLFTLALILTGSAVPPAAADTPIRNNKIINVPLFVRDGAGKPLTAQSDPATPVYESRTLAPILAPDRHQLTLAEFNAPRGFVIARCGKKGTETVIRLTGLVPNGVYTMWLLTFRSPGFDPTFANLIGLGAIGSRGGTQNVVQASPAGTAELTVTAKAGALSMFGNLTDCWVADEYEVHVVGAYHIDGVTHGATPGPDGSFVEQFGFIF